MLDIASAALDDVRQQTLPVVASRARRRLLETGVEQAEERAEAFLDAAVRCRGHQQQVPASITREGLQQLMTLVLATLALAARACRAMRLIDDHEIGRRAQEGARGAALP